MFLIIIILKQNIKITCLFNRFIITNTKLYLFLSLNINLKSIIIYCQRCSRTKKGYNSSKIRFFKMSA